MQKLAEICVKRPVFATMLVMSLVVLGWASYMQLGVDLFPKIDFPNVIVQVTLEGAGPEEIESQITKPVEEALNTISGMDELRSVSQEGVSLTIATFKLERDVESAAQDVRDKISRIQNRFPFGTDPPIIEKVDPDATPVTALTVSGNRSLREITEIARKQIKEPLEGLSGVGSIDIVGGRLREIQVYLDPHRMQAYRLTIDKVRQALQTQNVEIPGGRVDRPNQELVLRTMGRVEQVEQFNDVIVDYVKNAPIKISDIGRVEDGVVEPRNLSRYNGKNAVTLLVRKQSGTNTVKVADSLFRQVDTIRKALPADLNVEISRDLSRFIRRSVGELMFHLILGGVLASFVVLLFLRNLRSAFIAAISIPTSLIATFTLMRWMDFTVNNLTLLGLTLSVGIVIDDAIVVLENIFRHVEEGGEPPERAAVSATAEIGLAVMATTLSLVVIFLPVGFMSGIVGRFFSSFGLTMAFSVMVSLLVAFTMTPMLCSVLFRAMGKKGRGREIGAEGDAENGVEESRAAPAGVVSGHQPSSRSSKFYGYIDRAYGAMLNWSMTHRWAIVIISILVVFSTLPIFMMVGKDVIPFDDTSEYELNLKLPPGYTLEMADAVSKKVEAEISGLRGVQNILVSIGDPDGFAVNNINLYVRLLDAEKRKFTQFQAMTEARQALKKVLPPDIRSSVQTVSTISTRGNTWSIPVNFSLRGDDLKKLEQLSTFITQEMRKIPGFLDVDTTLEPGKPELRVELDREKAAALGVRAADVASGMRTMVGGDKIGKFRDLDEQYDVRLRLDDKYRNDPETLQRVMIPSQTVRQVELANLARLRHDTGPVQIERLDRRRNVTILSNLATSKPLASALDDVKSIVARAGVPPTYDVVFTGRAKTLAESQTGFLVAFVLSIIFMYMVLASQFESFLHPITIMLSLPLCVPFALLSLWVTNQTLNIYSALGLLVLFGIVKKNAILQVDYANTLRRRGLARNAAVVEACHMRLRPILMTTIAFVAGMIPIALGTGPGSASRRSIAIVAIGGQTLCLLITLLITPVAYTLFDGLREKSKTFARVRLSGLERFRHRWAEATSHFFSLFQ
ncbi:MAG TPA: efflux RND transporter permease subunit [Acidobacteriota bacterium]|jgi:HAE1 family hydrophobic/amphiphilic exporter-1|nr:efflux RND transporter permease subunit [Acidobacteriota bacterium]